MSTFTPFTRLGLFPFCVEDKTAAELAAIGSYVPGTLDEIMALWWLLETVDFTFGAATKTSLQVGNTDNLTQPYTILAPPDRLCGVPGGFGAGSDVSDPFTILSNDAWASLLIGTVYHNTTDSNYALIISLFHFTVGGGLGDQYGTFQKPGWVSNGGTCTVFGSTVPSFRDSSAPDADFSISNPTYYTPA